VTLLSRHSIRPCTVAEKEGEEEEEEEEGERRQRGM
jgi:hypothetical protein